MVRLDIYIKNDIGYWIGEPVQKSRSVSGSMRFVVVFHTQVPITDSKETATESVFRKMHHLSSKVLFQNYRLCKKESP